MINSRRIAQLAKKWQRAAALERKRPTMTATTEVDGCSTAVAGKGHCVMYTTDGGRFVLPLAYLSTVVLSELPRMSEEVFGFAGREGGIKLPCDAMVMEYAMSLLRRSASAEMEAAFLSSMVMPCYYAAPPVGVSQHVIVCNC
ncbi:auxin-responsive protein SAUR36-like [Triticum dicoccoides]|uniref:auxin-responsive protein SAUR36-like n=1 Tax=Triticum dicoccoides TaxID=85692 RepID=UPI00188E19AA|nr:auxin-responsive protein SAUR36-like [Triticum dicoccoides]